MFLYFLNGEKKKEKKSGGKLEPRIGHIREHFILMIGIQTLQIQV
jgi:hypothetical protein